MQHPEEGTLHGWLDGALDAGEAARVEAHVVSCAACASAVADARGFIAASSRILSALDDVPAGAIPPARAIAAAPGASAARVRPSPRSLRLARMPYARAAAAVVFLAAGTFAIARLVGPEAERAGRLPPVIPVVNSPAAPPAVPAVVLRAAAPPTVAPASVQSGSLTPGRKVAVAHPEKMGAPLSTVADAAKPAPAPNAPADSSGAASAVAPSAAIGSAGSSGNATGAPRIAAQLRANAGDALSKAVPLESERRRDSMTLPAERTLEGLPATDDPRVISALAAGAPARLIRRRHYAVRPGVVITLETESGASPPATTTPASRREAASDEVATDSVASGGGVITTIRWTDSAGVRISLSGPVGRDELLALRKRVR